MCGGIQAKYAACGFIGVQPAVGAEPVTEILKIIAHRNTDQQIFISASLALADHIASIGFLGPPGCTEIFFHD